jgi:predicted Zn-dependent protease
VAVVASAPAFAQQAKDDDGVKVRPPSVIRHVVSAAKIEKAGQQQYRQLREQAIARKALVPADDPQAQRVQGIAKELIPHANKWNARAKDWQWELILIKSPVINALCMPGGKIVVFTGLLDTLKLTDDELAVVIGHEMAHAVREHARARAVKSTLTRVGAGTVAILLGGNIGEIAKVSGGLMTLKFNRSDERDADLVGMELAARAGYNPEAGITLWEKMEQLAAISQPPWLSTHPTTDNRIKQIKVNLKRVQPLYERARANRPSAAN